jgi:hypothetical protein
MNLTLIDHLNEEANVAARMCARAVLWDNRNRARRWAVAHDVLADLLWQAQRDYIDAVGPNG